MEEALPARRLRRLPTADALGRRVRVARGARARLLGLAGIRRERAGPGLLIPRCSSVHTFGMRFELDLVFLDAEGRPLATRQHVGRGRIVSERGADAVLELPSRPAHHAVHVSRGEHDGLG